MTRDERRERWLVDFKAMAVAGGAKDGPDLDYTAERAFETLTHMGSLERELMLVALGSVIDYIKCSGRGPAN